MDCLLQYFLIEGLRGKLKLTNIRVKQHCWRILSTGQRSTSWATTLIFPPYCDLAFWGRASSPGTYMSTNSTPNCRCYGNNDVSIWRIFSVKSTFKITSVLYTIIHSTDNNYPEILFHIRYPTIMRDKDTYFNELIWSNALLLRLYSKFRKTKCRRRHKYSLLVFSRQVRWFSFQDLLRLE